MKILKMIEDFKLSDVDQLLDGIFYCDIASYMDMFDVAVDPKFGKAELSNERISKNNRCCNFNGFIKFGVKQVVEARRKQEDDSFIKEEDLKSLELFYMLLGDRTGWSKEIFMDEAGRYNRVRWWFRQLFSHYAMYSEWFHNSKQVYLVDKDFLHKLEETKSLKIYPSMYGNLPYSTFLIASPDEREMYIVNIRVINNTLVMSYLMHLTDSTMGFTGGILELGTEDGDYAEMNADILDYREVVMLQFTTYLISEQPEITDRTEPITGTNRSNVKRNSKVTVSEVGYRYGSALRLNKTKVTGEANASSSQKSRKSISPYMRCAHWHSFWTGKKDGSEERKLIVKWLPPTYCAGVLKDATIHKVIN